MQKQTPHNTEISASRQRTIEECLLQNMVQHRYDHISISDMCRQMGISRRLYYTYFPDKDACLISLIDRILHESIDSIPITWSKKLPPREIIAEYLRFWRDHAVFLDVIEKNGMKSLLIDRSYHYFMNDGSIVLSYLNTPDVKSDNTILWLYSAIRFAIIFRWHEHKFDTPLEEMAIKYERLLKEPLIQDVF